VRADPIPDIRRTVDYVERAVPIVNPNRSCAYSVASLVVVANRLVVQFRGEPVFQKALECGFGQLLDRFGYSFELLFIVGGSDIALLAGDDSPHLNSLPVSVGVDRGVPKLDEFLVCEKGFVVRQ
jgi:hypothetical protein